MEYRAAACSLLNESVASPCLRLLLCTHLLASVQFALAQQAVAPPGNIAAPDLPPALQSPGVIFASVAQTGASGAAIEQARLRAQAVPPVDIPVDANGTALSDADAANPEDDSLGAQRILKTQEPVRAFVLTGSASVVYTNNVALTRRATRHDIFAILDAGIGWTPHLAKNLDANFTLHAAAFRYDRTPELDFDNLSFGAGLSYALPKWSGAVVFGRYDFTELLNRDGDQILMDHALSLGLQRSIALGRSHGVSFGAIGSVGFSDPSAAQRHQLGVFAGYHLRLTRQMEMDLTCRPAVYFYADANRTDLNQIVTGSLRYRMTDWADLSASFSYGLNRSNHVVFDYNLLTIGGSVGVAIRF